MTAYGLRSPKMAFSSLPHNNAGRLPVGIWSKDSVPINIRRIFYGEAGYDNDLGPFSRPAGLNPPTVRNLISYEDDRDYISGVYRATYDFVDYSAHEHYKTDKNKNTRFETSIRQSIFFPDWMGAEDVLTAIKQAYQSWLATGPIQTFSTPWSGFAAAGNGLAIIGYLDELGCIAWARPFDILLGAEVGESVVVGASKGEPEKTRKAPRSGA